MKRCFILSYNDQKKQKVETGAQIAGSSRAVHIRTNASAGENNAGAARAHTRVGTSSGREGIRGRESMPEALLDEQMHAG